MLWFVSSERLNGGIRRLCVLSIPIMPCPMIGSFTSLTSYGEYIKILPSLIFYFAQASDGISSVGANVRIPYSRITKKSPWEYW